MLRFVLVLAALVAVAVASPLSDCSYPCPASLLPTPICGQLIGGNEYHTFQSECALDCHAKANPQRAFQAIGPEGERCAASLNEIRYPIDQTNEFNWPYSA